MSPLLLSLLLASEAPGTPPPGLRVRVDPFVTLVAGGASVGFDVLPAQIDSRLSVAAFVVDVPRFLVPFVVDHDEQLQLTETCFQIGWMTSSSSKHTGFFFGPELYAYQLRYTDEDQRSRNATAHELYVHATAGFTWFPFQSPAGASSKALVDAVYVMPWLTAGLPVWHTGGAKFSDGTVIDDRAFNWHGTVSIGLQLF